MTLKIEPQVLESEYHLGPADHAIASDLLCVETKSKEM